MARPGTQDRYSDDIARRNRQAEIRRLLGEQKGNRNQQTGGFNDPDAIYRLQQEQQSLNTVGKQYAGGMANYYDDSWGQLMGSLDAGDAPEDSLQRILQNFQGKPKHLEEFLRQASPFLAAGEAKRLRGSKAMQFIGDEKNWDLGAMAGYGQAAGQIGRGAADATRQAQSRLSASGLGRGSARAALEQQGMQQAGAAQGDLWSRTFQQAQQNRWNSSLGLLDAHRMISQMALGQQITPREQQQGSGGMGAAAGIAGGLGGLLGGIGSLVGAL